MSPFYAKPSSRSVAALTTDRMTSIIEAYVKITKKLMFGVSRLLLFTSQHCSTCGGQNLPVTVQSCDFQRSRRHHSDLAISRKTDGIGNETRQSAISHATLVSRATSTALGSASALTLGHICDPSGRSVN